jgi:hypothetical protein
MRTIVKLRSGGTPLFVHEALVQFAFWMLSMDQDFKAYLSKIGISEDKYIGGSRDAQATLVKAFEESKRGMRS